MTATSTSVFPLQSLNRADLESVLYGLPSIVAVHEVVFDEFGSIVETELIWWNEAFQKIRKNRVTFRQSISEGYIEPHSVMVHINKAWKTGFSVQYLQSESSARNHYNCDDKPLAFILQWKRVGDYIVQETSDLSECLSIQEKLADQKSIIAEVHRKRALAVERERIAHNLHDSTIQYLYATSLALSNAPYNTEQENLDLIAKTIASISNVIDGIRREILDVESMKASPLETQLQDVMVSILSPVNGEFSLTYDTARLSNDIVPHIRAVCTEAASNAVRHGMATKVDVSLRQVGESLVLTISDNGLGVIPDAPQGNGLKNMRERAQSLGGTMTIDTNEENGARIVWAVPHPRGGGNS